VYTCNCKDIREKIDIATLSEYANNIPDVCISKSHELLCGREGLNLISNDIRIGAIDRVVIAGCSPRKVEKLFRAHIEKSGLNPWLVEFVNLREQCAFVHDDKTIATKKAKSLLKMGISKCRILEPLESVEIEIVPKVLVIGGGVAGMSAALELAEHGIKTYIVEREPELGGRTYKLSRTFPTTNCGICCIHDCKNCILTPKLHDIYSNGNIEVFTSSDITEISGSIGNFNVKFLRNNKEHEMNVGGVIIATGSQTYDPSKISEYGYMYDDVVTSLELESLLANINREGLRRPSDKKIPKRINFVQCVGSRTIKCNLHCSIVCCIYAIGQARLIKEIHPNIDIYIHYMDLRGPYKGVEECYEEAQQIGINFVRGRVAEILKIGENLIVRTEDMSVGETIEIESDLVVLSVGQEPSEGTETLAKMLHKELDVDGFFKDVNLEYSSELENSGIFVAGCAQGPKGIRYSVADGKIAARNTISFIEKGKIMLDPIKAYVIDANCDGCAYCIEPCPYNAVTLLEYMRDNAIKKTVEIDKSACRGCGVCQATCPKKGIFVNGFTNDQISAMITSALEGVD
jgi:heterodisulfide reductase subunit A